MKIPLALIFALFIEIVLLLLIFLVLVVGLLGVFVPFLPGLFLVGVAAAVYSLLVRNDYGKITPKIHHRLLKIKNKIFSLRITKKIMNIIAKIKNQKKEKIKKDIWRHGLILLGFNAVLILTFIYGFVSLVILVSLLGLPEIMIAFIPLLTIFLFAGGSAVVWYRFGQILSQTFKQKRIFYTTLVVLISLLPLLIFLILISLPVNFGNPLTLLLFLGFLLMVSLAAAFELLLVNLGVITRVK